MDRGALQAMVRGVAESDTTEATQHAHTQQSSMRPKSRDVSQTIMFTGKFYYFLYFTSTHADATAGS